MISLRAPLLEKFGIWTVVMSYFGKTHQSFILLSKLNKQSRAMLDKNYEAFLNSMIKNNVCLKFNRRTKSTLYLPWDLFKYSICLFDENALNTFINVIQKIKDKNGYYFSKHFMHSRLCINEFIILSDLIENFYPKIEQLKTFEAIKCTKS